MAQQEFPHANKLGKGFDSTQLADHTVDKLFNCVETLIQLSWNKTFNWNGTEYKLPDQAEVDTSTQSELKMLANLSESSEGSTLKTKLFVDGANVANAKAEASRTSQKSKKHLLSMAEYRVQCYSIKLINITSPNRTPQFVHQLKRLTDEYAKSHSQAQVDDSANYNHFFSHAGTHYVHEITCGGILQVSISAHSASEQRRSAFDVSTALQLMQGLSAGGGISVDLQKSLIAAKASIRFTARPSLDWTVNLKDKDWLSQLTTKFHEWKQSAEACPVVTDVTPVGIEKLAFNNKYKNPHTHEIDENATAAETQLVLECYSHIELQRKAYCAHKHAASNEQASSRSCCIV